MELKTGMVSPDVARMRLECMLSPGAARDMIGRVFSRFARVPYTVLFKFGNRTSLLPGFHLMDKDRTVPSSDHPVEPRRDLAADRKASK